ncbi:3-deoxy-D-manno-octulosonic acid transferase [Pedobacter yulinensis]|uniref:3-deoxy-D-manno-octulosonic acid transferase n=1 Tax=Pedobacter yulinensis TaxID=2126353 RepID=A0A2T3HQB0_9SPHI|nr:glycosyltransferase N-terminal domain-containing protein [Pedobacter yulinensis]PST84581.1 3-deoxy-D-manno-octulosonic acid transferase [Pedobacter yulinensis]
MLLLYNLSIRIYGLVVRLVALWNGKARLFIRGRQDVWKNIAAGVNPSQKHVWLHFPSLGEFEQGRPVLEALKAAAPAKPILITFFSPSGYEIRKNYPLADGVFYLPLDSARNARRLIDAFNPEMAIFVKYDYWYHYFRELSRRQIPLYMVSAIFRQNQVYFKWYGGFNRHILKAVSWFFLQNQESVALLRGLGFSNLSLAGDTRFDRVAAHAAAPAEIPEVELFAAGHPVLIAGSTWPPDEKLLAGLMQKQNAWKMVLAPHEIGEAHISDLKKRFPDALLFSAYSAARAAAARVLIIDNIGMLSSLYRYGKIAYIGGGFGAGIHNTLEAAAFGLPVIYGPNDHKFQEAKDLRAAGAARRITDENSLRSAFDFFAAEGAAGERAREYVQRHTGATQAILRKILV